jgi:CRP-like cAMP-binding protein
MRPHMEADGGRSGRSPAQKLHPGRNRLLAALPSAELAELDRFLQPVQLSRGSVLYEPGARVQRIYFPTGCVVSLIQELTHGASVGIAVVGSEGAVGIPVVTGGESMTNRAVVQSAGSAYCLTSGHRKREFLRDGALAHLLLRYTQVLIVQMTQTAACNRHHSLEQRLSRWLLASIDRLSSGELMLTQEFLSRVLGVRREGVSVAAGRLQAQGAIHYSRGHITLLDRRRLEQAACECYELVKRESERLFPVQHRDQPAPQKSS